MSIFVSLDVETANRSSQDSICQIGIAKYQDGNLIDEYTTLVKPEGNFAKKNIEIHGITKEHVKDAPTFPEIYSKILEFIGDHNIAAHTSFDSRVIRLACATHNLTPPKNLWVDTSLIARRTWDEVSQRGYNLPNLCEILDFEYQAHDALEDAKACAHVLLCAMSDDNLTLAEISSRGRSKPKNKKSYPARGAQEGNKEGEFYGKTVVFTGNLPIAREIAIKLAVNKGYSIKDSVSKKVDYLIMGIGGEDTTKHKRALELSEQGHPIIIASAIRIFSTDEMVDAEEEEKSKISEHAKPQSNINRARSQKNKNDDPNVLGCIIGIFFVLVIIAIIIF